MASQKFKLLDLPTEIFKAILVEAARVRGLTRALRLRLVCKFFSDELVEALRVAGFMDECNISPSKWPYVRPYIEKRLLERRTENLPTLHAISRIAEILSSKDGAEPKYEDVALQLLQRACIAGRQNVRDLLGSKEYIEEGFDYDLLTGAVVTNNIPHVKRAVNAKRRKSGIFGQAAFAAVAKSNYEALNILLAAPAQQDTFDVKFSISMLQISVTQKDIEMFEYLLGLRQLQSFEIMFGDNARHLSADEAGLLLHTSSAEMFNEVLMILEARTRFCDDGRWLANLLRCSFYHGWPYMTRALLTFKDPNDIKRMVGGPYLSCLYRAVEGGHPDVVKVVLDLGWKIYSEELRIAASAGNIPVLKLLLDSGGDLNSDHARNGLYGAAKKGFIDTVRFLLDSGMDPNAGDVSALIGAVKSEHAGIVRLLVERGIDVDRALPEARQAAEAAGLDSMIELLGEYETSAHTRQSSSLTKEEASGH